MRTKNGCRVIIGITVGQIFLGYAAFIQEKEGRQEKNEKSN
jgi:hypothetical protein